MQKQKYLRFYANKLPDYKDKLCNYSADTQAAVRRLLMLYINNGNTIKAAWWNDQPISSEWLKSLHTYIAKN